MEGIAMAETAKCLKEVPHGRVSLDEICEHHRVWLSSRGRSGQRACLIGDDLAWANLSWRDLSQASLALADLFQADLSASTLTRTDLGDVHAPGVKLFGAVLREANVRRACLWFADLQCADLRGADLRDADLFGANLQHADLEGANLEGACLTAADLAGSSLAGRRLDPTVPGGYRDLDQTRQNRKREGVGPTQVGRVMKSELAKRLASSLGLSVAEARKSLDALLETIGESLQRGESVSLAGLGKFQTHSVAAHGVLHPVTRRPMTIPTQSRPRFRAGKKLKEAVA